jgi:putative protease
VTPPPARALELVCPAGTPAGLRAAVDAGAHAVYCGFRDETNARNFPGLNFDRIELRAGIAHAHGRGAKVLVALNTFMRAGATDLWKRGVDDAVAAGADALILADIGLIAYAREMHPRQRLHLSVQAAAATPEAIALYRDAFAIARVVLPRVLTVAEIARLTQAAAPCETEVFVFGGMCVMAEGRCLLSSYATGKSPACCRPMRPASRPTWTGSARRRAT